jgi:hypothetical protein
VKISIAQFLGQVQVRPDIMENLLEPTLTSKLLGADFVVLVDVVVLLQLDPVVVAQVRDPTVNDTIRYHSVIGPAARSQRHGWWLSYYN